MIFLFQAEKALGFNKAQSPFQVVLRPLKSSHLSLFLLVLSSLVPCRLTHSGCLTTQLMNDGSSQPMSGKSFWKFKYVPICLQSLIYQTQTPNLINKQPKTQKYNRSNQMLQFLVFFFLNKAILDQIVLFLCSFPFSLVSIKDVCIFIIFIMCHSSQSYIIGTDTTVHLF